MNHLGGTFATGRRRRPGRELDSRQKALNKAHARLRYPVERGIARLKTWRIFRKARCSPTCSPPRPKPSSPWRATAGKAQLLNSSSRYLWGERWPEGREA
ncbi:transposase family protein [Streptomyces sp. 1222.5]|uniref:transposase family protein n=1 Tax=Streptomyces sp. 1222.5 TaxID=1881026 RepID=UPI003EB8D5AB